MRCIVLLDAVHDASTPPDQQLREWHELLDLTAELGLEGVVCGQHFLAQELRYFQPVPLLADFGVRRPGLRLVLGILLLSLLNPVEVAENVATLDVLTAGRVTLGAAAGYVDREAEAFGVDPRERVPRLERALETVKRLWAGEDGAGALRPVQQPRPPIWLGAQALPGVRRAARIADAWYAPPFPTHDALRSLRQAFVEERERSGLPPAAEFPVRRELLVAGSKEEARRGAATRIEARYRLYVKWGLAAGGGLRDAGGGFAEATDAEADGRFLLGTPEDCAEGLARLRDDVGMTHVVVKPQWPGLPHAEAVRQLELLGTEVLPTL